MILLQFGCGSNRLDGWQNYDADLELNNLPLPFPNDHADVIFGEHIFEHFSPSHFLRLMDECRRILKPGGTLRVCMPVIERLGVEHGRDISFGHGHGGIYTETSIFHILRLAGFDMEKIIKTGRKEIDGHWRAIGTAKDDLETLRMEAQKF